MPLSSALSSLKSSLAAAYDSAVEEGINNAGNSTILSNLSASMSSAIDVFSLEAVIETDSTVLPGGIQTTSAGPSASPATGKGTGKISGMNVDKLKNSILTALEKTTENGSKDGADSQSVNKDLGEDLAAAILEYYNSAMVETEVELTAFQTVGIPPITPAAIASGEKGSGSGTGGTMKGLTNLLGLKSNLAIKITLAYDDSIAEGSQENASTSEINSGLGDKIGQAINDFVTSCIVKTDDVFQGGTGETAPTSMMPTPTGPVPTTPPPMTIPGASGIGIGKIL